MVKCSCGKRAIIYVKAKGKYMCEDCFLKYFERTALNTIRKHKLIDKRDKIAVGVSGGKDSLALLYFLNEHFDNEVFGVFINEGIKGYREVTSKDLRKYCKKFGVECYEFSFKEEIGMTLDEMVKRGRLKPCSYCGVFRRYLLNKKARELGATKLAMAHNLDDEAQTILMNLFTNDVKRFMRLGYMTGVKTHPKFVPRIKPFRLLYEKEVLVYGLLKGIRVTYIQCPYAEQAYRVRIAHVLWKLERKYPLLKYNVVRVFDPKLKELKERAKDEELKECKICGEVTNRDICKACEFKRELKIPTS